MIGTEAKGGCANLDDVAVSKGDLDLVIETLSGDDVPVALVLPGPSAYEFSLFHSAINSSCFSSSRSFNSFGISWPRCIGVSVSRCTVQPRLPRSLIWACGR